jgi:hypothetical protein
MNKTTTTTTKNTGRHTKQGANQTEAHGDKPEDSWEIWKAERVMTLGCSESKFAQGSPKSCMNKSSQCFSEVEREEKENDSPLLVG